MSNQLLESVVETTLTNEPSRRSPATSTDTRLNKIRRTFPADQQVKYLYLQAEVDVLLGQLQSLQQQP